MTILAQTIHKGLCEGLKLFFVFFPEWMNITSVQQINSVENNHCNLIKNMVSGRNILLFNSGCEGHFFKNSTFIHRIATVQGKQESREKAKSNREIKKKQTWWKRQVENTL